MPGRKIVMGKFFKDFTAESKRIIWPTKKELSSKTTTVIVTSIFVAIILFLMDLLFSNAMVYLHQWI
ncbi:MAG: preprotein translocase subunit SecE [Epulopiscium sp. Nuni2H_MBin003]|nr:MAG: preprotein translocase subunit SecE [Epulopiscium sp. Nuni2H_MBin003]